jgi:hypothetical protein
MTAAGVSGRLIVMSLGGRSGSAVPVRILEMQPLAGISAGGERRR